MADLNIPTKGNPNADLHDYEFDLPAIKKSVLETLDNLDIEEIKEYPLQEVAAYAFDSVIAKSIELGFDPEQIHAKELKRVFKAFIDQVTIAITGLHFDELKANFDYFYEEADSFRRLFTDITLTQATNLVDKVKEKT